MTRRVILFARPPIPGRCKTRLAAALGDEDAAALHAAFVRDAVTSVRSARLVPELHAAESPDHPFFAGLGIAVRVQASGSLGERMAAALEEARPALLLGTDAPALPPALLARAAALLDGAELVLTPVGDGGFVIVGASSARAARCLADTTIRWSSAHALADTMRAARRAGSRTALSAPWLDVDRMADLPTLRALLSARPDLAPATAALLASGLTGARDLPSF